MARQFRIPLQSFTSIQAIGRFADKLSVLTEAAESVPPGRRNPQSVIDAFASKAGIAQGDAQSIVTQILGFHALRDTYSLAPEKLYDAVTEALQADASDEWKAANLQNWERAKSVLMEIFAGDNPLYVVQKATRLLYEHQNVVYDMSIITDVRPIFDASAQSISELLISHVLGIEYHDGTQRRQMYATIDSKDVAKLKQWCERAQTKEATLKKAFEVLPFPSVTAGESDDA